MELPLSKREWNLYKELKTLFLANKDQNFDDASYAKYQEWLLLLSMKGVLWDIRIDGGNLYQLEMPFDDFEEWLLDQNKKAKRMNSREWKIALVSAVVGAVIGLLPTIIPWIHTFIIK